MPGVALGLGAVLVADERPSFAMHWACIQEFWQVMTKAGPWHARSLQMGEDHMSALKQDFLAEYTNSDTDSVVHHPRARLIVIQKVKAAL